MSEERELLDAVRDAARLGGSRALQRAKSVVEYESKHDGSPVTAVDREVELLLRDWIMKHYPDDGILGEEFPEHKPGARRRWILDPIDGTQSYIRGVPLWGTMVAVARGEDVIAGAINCAASGDLVWSARGEGCWWNDARCNVSSVAALGDAAVLTTDERNLKKGDMSAGWQRLSEGARIVRGWSDCYAFVLVATGRAEAVVELKMSPWDAAAPLAIVRDAGGVATDFAGRETAFGGSLITTNALVAREVRRTLSGGAVTR
ncbi:MAG TPA: inositol monophosphatase family protein [Gemmatimonadaceae bacterium]|nr:inositol monophosphatase family protein [Gemmatimonadaceae bacterium]